MPIVQLTGVFEDASATLAIEDAVKVLLKGLGEDINRQGLKKTPQRVAKALINGTRGYKQNVRDIVDSALFPESGASFKIGHAGGAGGLVVVRDLDLFSYCESCLLPFQVKCHIGYVPCGQRVVGLSKLSRVAEMFAKRLQDPYRLAEEICLALQHSIEPSGVAVILKCKHIDFHKGWVDRVVKSGSGVFLDEFAEVWSDFSGLSRLIEVMGSDNFDNWCPFRKTEEELNPSMVSSVFSILGSIGDDPLRKELVNTPYGFLNWLMSFKNCNMDFKLNDFCRIEIGGILDEEDSDVFRYEMNIPFWSQCEHHILPFYGVVHVGYYGSNLYGSDIAKSILQSVVRFYGFKLQVQERLTRQIAETVSLLMGGDAIVVVEATHTCMISRGIEKFGSTTATIALLGRFSTDPFARKMFMQMIDKVKIGIESDNKSD